MLSAVMHYIEFCRMSDFYTLPITYIYMTIDTNFPIIIHIKTPVFNVHSHITHFEFYILQIKK